jgi:organic hydroperoxide reductase OsmC/OhrA
MSQGSGTPRTSTPAAGDPSGNRTTPVTRARGLAATRFSSAVGGGAEAQAAQRKRRRRAIRRSTPGILRGLNPGGAMADAETKDATEKIQIYTAGVTWTGDGMGCGVVSTPQSSFDIPIGGAKELGGCGKGVNPEELLLSAVGACFVNTWAIFLKKLALTYAEPALRMRGELEADPAGGFRMRRIQVFARVPASLWAERRSDVEKTVKLAEKYCIISKVAKAAMPVEVEVETV